MKIGYARVSTIDQSLDLQLDALKKAGCERIYTEKISGAKDDRPELAKALDMLRPGDTFIVYKLDRLARSTKKLIEVAEQLKEIGVEFISIKDNIDTNTPTGKLMFGMLAVLAEFERDIIRERTMAGLEAARARGRKGGRPATNKKKIQQALTLYDSKSYSIAEIEDMAGISRATLYRALKKRNAEIKPDADVSKTAKIKMHLRVENNSKFTRGKGKVRESIEQYLKLNYKMENASGEYVFYVPYVTVDDLEKKVDDIIREMDNEADLKNCFIEVDVYCEELGLRW
jgi:DNA invertase Pin-like site-specific DNA recombinase